MKSFTIEKLTVQVYGSRRQMGAAAASDVAARMKEALERKDRIRMAFAAAPSQNELVAVLAEAPGLDWSRVTAFQMDEYVGIPPSAPQTHQTYLRERLFSRVRPGEIHLLDGMAPPRSECQRFADLVRQGPIDIVCLGIGDNGHIAFNEPHAADFGDLEAVRIVELDRVSRRQQVRSGLWEDIEEVPRFAITLTVSALMSAGRIFCVVPGQSKREAVRQTLQGPLSTRCPASVLRTHPACTLYLELDSHER